MPEAFDDSALLFAVGILIVRAAQIAPFRIASRDDPSMRKSVTGLAISTAIGVSLLVLASFTDGALQGGLWALALGLDMAGPYFFGAEPSGGCPMQLRAVSETRSCATRSPTCTFRWSRGSCCSLWG
ncbi:MAG: low temperature requirement protein A [Actinomycetota bacterium]|nr:low temperature requirement protein A [Actinomycetota bacterium]